MESNLKIDVAALDDPHRRALEEVMGLHLRTNQRLIIQVTDINPVSTGTSRPSQSLGDWTKVLDGLNAAEVDEIDAIVKTRADLTRDPRRFNETP